MAHFTISEEDWKNIAELSKEARNTPVIALSSANAMAGRDLASMARERVFAKWREVGERMGFDATEIQPVDETNRIIEAKPLTDRR